MAEEKENPEEENTGEGEEGEQKKGPSKLILIIVAVVVLAVGGGAAFFFLAGESDEEKAEVVTIEETEATPVIPQAFFYEVPEMLVNLSSFSGSGRYLKLKVNLEVATEADLARLEQVMPRIVDDFQMYLRQLRVEDLRGSAGIYRLKEALLLRASQAAAPLEIADVLLLEILVQ